MPEQKDTVLYSQLQPWSSVAATPCMEQVAGPPMPARLGQYYQTPRPHPWRPTLGYETIEAIPLNPAHAARAALYTRYTPLEWTQGNLRNYNESDTTRNYSERLRNDFVRVMRETDERTTQGQRESGRRIGERITDTTFWRNEVRTELEGLIRENNLLGEAKRNMWKSIDDVEGLIHIAQECLYHREKREGIDLCHDIAEQAILKEIECYRNTQEKMRNLYSTIQGQINNNRAAQHDLEIDVKSKESALGSDQMCHQFNNFSKGIQYYGGIEKFDPTITNTTTWAENSNRMVQRSQSERVKSMQMRSDIDNLVNTCAQELWDAWSNTNNALARRAAEILEAKSKLQMHLHNLQQEIFSQEKNIELLKKAILDKSNPMKVAHTRLEARTHRKGIELCRDVAQDKLVSEVLDIQDSIEILHRKLQEAEAQHQQMLKTRANLESDLHSKVNSLFIDREKCMGMRRSFPITSTIKY
ncbi:hypothetical protein NQ317_004853 [Molorchus minor]|uniref:Tektin n=1 Tax=Molorchus minor TaxID=1323400 RepID=A0ABQ9J7Q0_9CUCU|nr:hypothetical protein NQ317_004853 [Molorchus minor]